MNNKLNSLLSTIAITCAVGVPLSLTAVHELPVLASLTAPASYDLGYVWNSSTSTQNYVSADGTSPTSIALFTRTTDGAYYNYSHTFSNSGSHSNTSNYDLPDGLDITMTFNRSNTSWTDASPTYTGYYPTENKIGSDNTVGTIISKWRLKFDNQTNKDYILYLDHSSSPSGNVSLRFIQNTLSVFTYQTDAVLSFPTEFIKVLIPSYNSLEIFSNSTVNTRYLDAWYLQDLGVNASYDAGYDAGYEVGEDDGYADGLSNNPNILINAVESLIGMFVNFTFILFSLELFGVSILSIVGVLFGIIAIVWILKTIRGG